MENPDKRMSQHLGMAALLTINEGIWPNFVRDVVVSDQLLGRRRRLSAPHRMKGDLFGT
jgi:hypothetical protein